MPNPSDGKPAEEWKLIRQRSVLGCLSLIVLAVLFAVLLEQSHPTPRPGSVDTSSISYKTGFTVGKVTGREDAGMRHPKMDSGATRAFAGRLNLPSTVDRATYQQGWCDGYAFGYDSYSK